MAHTAREWKDDEGPLVRTGISPECKGEVHEGCPGIGKIGDEQIFCVCSCHLVKGSGE